MEMRKIYKIIVLALLLYSCEERTEIIFPIEDTGLVAVQAVLTNENISQEITLTLPYQQLNGTPLPARGATVKVIEGLGPAYTFIEDPNRAGVYVSAPFQAVSGTTYQLEIIYEDKKITARDLGEPVEPMEALAFQPVGNQFELSSDDSGQSPHYYDYQLSWKNTAACLPDANCTARVFFYYLKNIDVNDIYKPGKKQFLFPAGTTIIRKKHSVSGAYRNYLRSMLSETEWRGGVFDVERANAITNLSSGGIGFFAITSVVSDTTVVNP
jgi:hypothetical protein